jgi:hypothetical protein
MRPPPGLRRRQSIKEAALEWLDGTKRRGWEEREDILFCSLPKNRRWVVKKAGRVKGGRRCGYFFGSGALGEKTRQYTVHTRPTRLLRITRMRLTNPTADRRRRTSAVSCGSFRRRGEGPALPRFGATGTTPSAPTPFSYSPPTATHYPECPLLPTLHILEFLSLTVASCGLFCLDTKRLFHYPFFSIKKGSSYHSAARSSNRLSRG